MKALIASGSLEKKLENLNKTNKQKLLREQQKEFLHEIKHMKAKKAQ